MSSIQQINRSEFTQNKQHHSTLTDEQKLYNKQEAHSKLFQIVLERILLDGGLNNADN